MSSITLNAGEGSELAFDFPGLAGEYTITPTDLRPAMPKAGQKVARPVKKILMGSETKALVALLCSYEVLAIDRKRLTLRPVKPSQEGNT